MIKADNSKDSSHFIKRFQESFWWAAPISVIADLIAILGLFSLKQQSLANQQSTPPGAPYAEPRIFGLINISDAIVLTGFVTVFIIASTIYLAINLAQIRQDKWPYIYGSFLTLILGWFYFRLWLGEYGWIWILLAFVFLCGIATYLLARTPEFGSVVRIGCTLATISLVILTIFLIVSTGALSRVAERMKSVPTVSQNAVSSVRPSQQPAAAPLPALVATAENTLPSLQFVAATSVAYDLPREKWFPAPSEIAEGLFAGEIREVTNETASWGNADRLAFFQSMGRITSFERFYSHQNGCNSSDLKGVYIQIIFFQSTDGSKEFFTWASDDAAVKFVNDVGDSAYIFSGNDKEDGCQIDYVSTSFQRYNVFARARVKSITGKMSYELMESLSLTIARMIDERLKSEAK